MTQQISTLLELRTRIKYKKPEFIRQDNPKRMKLNDKWRKPKGIHSKIRHSFKGRRKMPSPGYKSPRKVKCLHNSGLKMIVVQSVDDLLNIKKENEGAVISKNVGMKKRLKILKKAKELDVNILNLNVDEYIGKIESFMSLKKKKDLKESRKEDIREKGKEKGIDEKEKPQLSEEERKESEKAEKDKVLIKKV
ncbi:50S ribosomal protein L32e [Candidatus Woesearchaeota archaeon]|nr:50S ribosomal protein L32e [Candidatus Woesearchaeota archaeon]